MPAGDAAIRKLNLTGNNIGDKGATLLAEMLKVGSRHPHVAHVNFPQMACYAFIHSLHAFQSANQVRCSRQYMAILQPAKWPVMHACTADA